jgi:hypothetical protein
MKFSIKCSKPLTYSTNAGKKNAHATVLQQSHFTFILKFQLRMRSTFTRDYTTGNSTTFWHGWIYKNSFLDRDLFATVLNSRINS